MVAGGRAVRKRVWVSKGVRCVVCMYVGEKGTVRSHRCLQDWQIRLVRLGSPFYFHRHCQAECDFGVEPMPSWRGSSRVQECSHTNTQMGLRHHPRSTWWATCHCCAPAVSAHYLAVGSQMSAVTSPQRDFLRLPAQAPGSHTLGSYAAGPCTPGPHDVSAIQGTLSHPGLRTVLQLQCTGEPSCCRCLGCTGNWMPEGSGTSQEVTQQRNCESASTDPKHLQQTSEGPDYEVREYNSEHRQ